MISNTGLENNVEILSESEKLQTTFAKILAKAIKNDENLRLFLKKESLKKFDNDYDILYQQVKDIEINEGESFREKLLNYTSVKELEKIESNLPLLTVFVPTLPNFNPDKWNAVNEIPKVAVNNGNMNTRIILYGDTGDSLTLKSNEIPGFPVLVVKQNERVVVSNTNNNKLAVSKGIEKTNFRSNNISFSFIDEAFDGSVSSDTEKKIKTLGISKLSTINPSTSRLAPSPNVSDPNAIDQINVDAYNSGSEWQRDYIYYGITPNSPNGTFKNNYSEFLTSFKLLPNFSGIAEQQGDPFLTAAQFGSPNFWLEGNFEFRLTILVNSKNGLGNEITKIMNVNPRDLYSIQYEEVYPRIPPYLWRITSITEKEYHPNIEILPWDLENYGSAWKFILYEIDPDQEVINSFENTTTFAANFEINGGVKDKVGAKFGASLTTTEKRTFSVKSTLTSDFLGEATLTFDQPIIIGYSNNKYVTREITTGNNLSISIEPRRVF